MKTIEASGIHIRYDISSSITGTYYNVLTENNNKDLNNIKVQQLSPVSFEQIKG